MLYHFTKKRNLLKIVDILKLQQLKCNYNNNYIYLHHGWLLGSRRALCQCSVGKHFKN